MTQVKHSWKPLEKKLSWSEIQTFVKAGEYHLLGRTKEDFIIYKEWHKKILLEYDSMTDYILHTMFHYDVIENNNKKRAELKDDLPKQVFLRLNDFPYSLEDDIVHHILWYSTSTIPKKEIENILMSQLPCCEYLYFENPVHLRSIRSIHHLHVFSRHKKL